MPSSGGQTCALDRKSTRLNSSHGSISYAVFCLKKTNEIEGRQCFPDVREIKPAVTAALMLNPKYASVAIVRECAEAGITLLWAFGISGPKDLPAGVQAECEAHGIKLVPGYCPFMFMEHTHWFHRWHGKFEKFIGDYPS